MSALADPTRPTERPLLRLATFTALAGYGLSRWAILMRPADGWRYVGLLALAAALAGSVGPLARRSRTAAGLVVVAIILLSFPVAGLRWHWLTHLRIAATADQIATGLSALPQTLVPYLGSGGAVRLDILLGAAVLVLDAAAVLAFAGRAGAPFGDGRRAAAALPLVALAIVPSTLIRPAIPYVQGLVLFVLLAAFVWGERVRSSAAGSAAAVLALGGIAGALIAPRLDHHHPWVDYRAWAGVAVRPAVARFDWNQTYGPLRWPQTGHVVMTVRAQHPDYWKAEDLDLFDGVRWRYGTASAVASLPPPDEANLTRFTQTIQVRIQGMQTPNIIAAGVASAPLGTGVPGGYTQAIDPGTWLADRTLGPGTTYQINTYSPQPTSRQLATAGLRYPARLLASDLELSIAQSDLLPSAYPQVRFPVFGSHRAPELIGTGSGRNAPVVSDGSAQAYIPATSPVTESLGANALLRRSPYAPAYALARRLAAGAATPFAFVRAVMRYLAHGFTYDQNPPPSRYPLETFLFSDRRGYCQQFSGAMALLLRMGGIPARVASGFTSGTAVQHDYVVTDTDAHAWVEVWFPHLGWVRRDPTPAADPALAGPSTTPIAKRQPSAPLIGSEKLPRREAATGVSAASAHSTPHPHPSDSPWLFVVIAALVLLGVLLAMRLWIGAGRRADPDLVAELDRAMARARRPLSAGATLTVLERRMSRSPDAAGYVRALRESRYGGGGSGPTSRQRRALRRELARGRGMSGRLRALWALPPRPGAPARRRP
jgi:transglutaminase-like putative cysteine protease